MSARRSRVAARWRIAGAALAGALALAGWLHPPTIDVLFRVDARLIDLWQRLSGEDEPSGEVVVIGVDSAAIREKGRWPWSRGDIAELVELVADAGARSLTLDVLLTEPGPYADVNLFRTFRQNAPEAIELLPESPDARLAEALDRLPVALAVAAGAEEAIADLSAQTFCADAARLTDAEARPYYVQCLLLPLEMFEARADAYAVAFAEQDLDGVVRRARAFVAQPYETADGEKAETIVTAMPVATVTACAGVDRGCLSFERDMPFLREVEANLSGYRMPLTRAEGPSPPPVPMTPSFGLWLDFGALRALGPGGEGPSRMISAAAVFQGDPDETARIEGKHAVVGYTRLGGIDQHTTPLAAESGTPGVLIQALAADNLIAGRVLAAPAWGRHLGLGFAAAAALLALVRFGARNLARLTAIGVALIAAPVAASWLAFEFGGTILNGATPAIAATLAWTPVLFGRIVAIRRDLATVRETAARDEARMAAARAIQLGTLPFAADFRDVGVETAAVCRPAQEVGGDFFELFRLTDGRIFAAVGDVSGKGLEASLVTALSKSIAGALTDRTPGPLGAALSEVSREFLRQAPHDWLRGKGGFVTLIAATVDPETGEAEFVAAGADPAAVVGPDGAARPVPLPEVAPLGWNEDHAFETARLRLAPGDLVVMFTDGVTEAEAPDGDLFGKARADALLAAAAAGGGPEAAVAALEAAVADHQAGGEATDDTTILALAWTGRRLAGEGEGRHEDGESPPAPAAEAAGG